MIRLHRNIGKLLTLAGVAKKQGRHPKPEDLGAIEKAAVVGEVGGEILWVGAEKDLPGEYTMFPDPVDEKGALWIPGLVDCHTHLVYGGQRHQDYAMRVEGKTYQEVAASGGGILRTVNATRATPLDELLRLASIRLQKMQARGVGCVEIKSGYGLSLDSELKILETVANLAKQTPVKLVPTFLAAHAVPPEFKGRADDYVEEVRKNWIPEIARRKLAVFFDVFVEEGYFSLAQAQRLAESALESGLKIKLHSDQFTELGSVPWAAAIGAGSVDHLDRVSEAGIAALAKSNTVGVLLPGASLFTRTELPPARKLVDAGARIAVSTDHNPGTCPSLNLPLMMTLACSQLRLTVAESVASVTYNAAAALGLEGELGTLEAGKQMRWCAVAALDAAALPHAFGETLVS